MNTTPYHPFLSEEAKTNYLAFYDGVASNWSVPSETKMIETSYGQTFVRISGAIDAPPLVLLHGAGSTSSMWMFSIEALSKHYRTYAVDSLINTGCVGRSIYTQAITNGDESSEWLNDLFDGLGLGNDINLIGASYGGWIANQYALRYQERLHKAVWIAPAGTVLPFSEDYLHRSMSLYMTRDPEVYKEFFRWNFKDFLAKQPQVLESMVAEFVLTLQSFVPPNPQEMPRLTALSDDELQAITIPTLFLIGENDVLYSANDAIERLNTIAPQIETQLIHDAGHDILLAQTEIVNQAILSFLKG
ncbi:MAG: enantioselective carboxylesterase CesB [Phototrophicaceae bacterium]